MLNFKVSDEVKSWGLLGFVVIVLVWYLSRKAGAVVEDAIDSINPLSNDNVFYGGVNAVGEAVTGDEYWTLGGAYYDAIHPWQNPDDVTDPGNTDSVFGYLFGYNKKRRLGLDIYDWFN